ncbi:unnamed protein product [Trichogramma brassicae]|uniref:Uncharacterized protein n=1 Tax=Trichogramma brassicae TaxID=86971 RepID=A0A6H5HY28_9HYME|nr:unnamed protein product [Trichogramma brassicae]
MSTLQLENIGYWPIYGRGSRSAAHRPYPVSLFFTILTISPVLLVVSRRIKKGNFCLFVVTILVASKEGGSPPRAQCASFEYFINSTYTHTHIRSRAISLESIALASSTKENPPIHSCYAAYATTRALHTHPRIGDNDNNSDDSEQKYCLYGAHSHSGSIPSRSFLTARQIEGVSLYVLAFRATTTASVYRTGLAREIKYVDILQRYTYATGLGVRKSTNVRAKEKISSRECSSRCRNSGSIFPEGASDEQLAQQVRNIVRLRGKIDWASQESRHDFLRQLDPITRYWQITSPPNLRPIFEPGEIDRLLVDCLSCDYGAHIRLGAEGFIDFVSRSGYRDRPELDADGQPPALTRTTAVHEAARLQRHEHVDNLLIIYDNYKANYADETGFTHFHAACAAESVSVVVQFIRHGVDLNVVWPRTGETGLHLALAGRRDIAWNWLLEAGADPRIANNEGLTALQIIARRSFDDARLQAMFGNPRRGFYRRWALDCFVELTQNLLTSVTCENVLSNMDPKDQWSICVAVTRAQAEAQPAGAAAAPAAAPAPDAAAAVRRVVETSFSYVNATRGAQDKISSPCSCKRIIFDSPRACGSSLQYTRDELYIPVYMDSGAHRRTMRIISRIILYTQSYNMTKF